MVDGRDDGSLLRPAGRSWPSPPATLGSLALHAVLLAAAVLVARGAERPPEPEPVHLTFVTEEVRTEVIEEPGGGGPDEEDEERATEPEPEPEPVAPPQRTWRRVERVETALVDPTPAEEPDAGPPVVASVDPADAGVTTSGSRTSEADGTGRGTGSRGGGSGGGSGGGHGTGTGTGSGTGPSDAPIFLRADMERPRLLSTERPRYTRRARDADARGDVVVRILVGRDGRVQRVDALSGHPVLVDEVLRVVRGWRYSPPQLRGRPVSIYMIQRITFEQR